MESTSLERAEGEKRQRRILFWGVVAVGVGWRLWRYGLRMPVWGDEAFVGLNVMDRDMWGLTKPLAYSQVAPVFFLWMEKAASTILGTSEYAMRAGPVAAGIAAVGLFIIWARMMLRPMGAALAVGIFSVGYYVVRHAVEIKPYSVDALMTLALLVPATAWWREREASSKEREARNGTRPACFSRAPLQYTVKAWHPAARPPSTRPRGTPRTCDTSAFWIWVLVGIVPVAIGFSYPAVFVAGAVSAGLLVPVCREKRAEVWAAYLVYNLAMVGAFAAIFLLAARGQYAETGKFMRDYWRESFPPGGVMGDLWWFVKVHAGEMMAYPMGGNGWGSVGTLALVVVGAVAMGRRKQDARRNAQEGISEKDEGRSEEEEGRNGEEEGRSKEEGVGSEADAGRENKGDRWDRAPGIIFLGGPFVLTLVAAVMERYPYGGSARVAQHLGPAICVLAGAGIEALILWGLRAEAQRRWAFLAVMVALIGIGLGGMVRDAVKPFKTQADEQARRTVEGAVAEVGKGRVVVLQAMEDVPVNYQWYLRRNGAGVVWEGRDQDDDGAHELGSGGLVCVMNFARGLNVEDNVVMKELKRAGWNVKGERVEQLQIGPAKDGPAYCEVVWLKRGS